ncbi:uncharacterized protein LOC18442779 [Amborella trichopoda]|uniref:uncharacterized protein LOC18442779 n=1 Tax=Amborella trichopoda TaxID=13333 RepID=UPI0009BCF054|nr:uncharacterized protein LOC18442779 [Amborella trichopoda]|eukprot:XP_020528340.1 uncharacterized protein LOC18442779 [Amborella trichopoda]
MEVPVSLLWGMEQWRSWDHLGSIVMGRPSAVTYMHGTKPSSVLPRLERSPNYGPAPHTGRHGTWNPGAGIKRIERFLP